MGMSLTDFILNTFIKVEQESILMACREITMFEQIFNV